MLISLSNHPSNLDPSAALATNGCHSVGRDVFRTSQGYVAAMPGGMAIEGYFETQAKAKSAQKWALGWSEAIWGRLVAENVTDLSDASLERALGPCVCGSRCVAWAKALRDSGALFVVNGEVILARAASAS